MNNIQDPNATQVAGSHYAGPYQHWDYVRKALEGRYLEGCASKYIARCRKKNGIQDLEKAIHYLEKMRWLYMAGNYHPATVETVPERMREAYAFIGAQEFGADGTEGSLLVNMAIWSCESDINAMIGGVRYLIGQLSTRG